MQRSLRGGRQASVASILLLAVASACSDADEPKRPGDSPALDAGGDGDNEPDAGQEPGNGDRDAGGDGDNELDAGQEPGNGDRDAGGDGDNELDAGQEPGNGDRDASGETPEPTCADPNDADCDGVPASEDCDDTDPALLAKSDDADCDGLPKAKDCDDSAKSELQRDEWGSCDPVVVFSKADGADPTSPENQDCLSPSICLTRADEDPWYNAAAVAEYESGEPSGLTFARGFQGETLTFEPWNTALRGAHMAFQPVAVSFADGSERHNLFTVKWTPLGKGGGLRYGRSRSVAFEKPAFSDFTQPGNQDCITDKVCLTRKDTQSLFNIAAESGYSAGSPSGTEWALGPTIGNRSTYQSFVDLSQSDPQSLLGKVLSLHITGTQLYYDVVFQSWGGGGGSGGNFGYVRTRALVPGCMDSSANNFDPRATIPTPCGDWYMFHKPDHADPTLAQNQDCITEDVCIARGTDGGLYNAKLAGESKYECDSSAPTGTSWSFGACAEATTFTRFRDLACGPQKVLYQPMCLHIPSANRYFDIEFLDFTGNGVGGGFAYIRKEYVTE